MKTKEIHSFKKGQSIDLDHIYHIQGLGGGDWWEKTGRDVPSQKDIDLGENLICTKTIKIIISIEKEE